MTDDVNKLPDELAAELAKLPAFETVEHARPAVDGPWRLARPVLDAAVQ
jgi:hypothetical protein